MSDINIESQQIVEIVEIHVDRNATAIAEEAITRAETVLQETINIISNIDNRNTIIFDAGFLKTGNVFKALSMTKWNIGGVVYENQNEIQINIPLAATGMQRWDRIFLNRENQFVLLKGEEFTDNPPIPVLLDNTLGYTFFLVTDTEIGTPTPPVIGDNFKKKSESNFLYSTTVGALPNLAIRDDRTHIMLTNATALKSLHSFDGANLYPGKVFSLTNNGTTDITIQHLSTDSNLGNILFEFQATAVNYALRPKETVRFFLNQNLDRAVFLGSNMTVANTNVRTIVLDNNSDGSVFTQGVTGNVLLKTYPIGKLKKNAVYRINLKMIKTGTGANFAVFVELDNKSNFPVNLVNSGAASNLYMGITRDMKTFTDNLGVLKASSFTNSGGYYTDIMVNASKPGIVDLNVDRNYSFKLIVTTTSLTDIIQLDSLMITEFTV